MGLELDPIELSPSQRGTRKLLDAMVREGTLAKEIAKGVYSMARPKMRASPDTPLNRSEILVMAEVYRDL